MSKARKKVRAPEEVVRAHHQREFASAQWERASSKWNRALDDWREQFEGSDDDFWEAVEVLRNRNRSGLSIKLSWRFDEDGDLL